MDNRVVGPVPPEGAIMGFNIGGLAPEVIGQLYLTLEEVGWGALVEVWPNRHAPPALARDILGGEN